MKKAITLLIATFCLFTHVNAQWEWQNPLPTGNELRSIDFTDANTGYIAGYFGTILKTTNGGDTWEVIRDNQPERLMAIDFTDAASGVAVGGKILRTTDGGVNWVEAVNVSGQELFTVVFPNSTTGYAAGNSGTILKTSDAGQTWIQQYSSPSLYLYASFFLNENKGYVGGGDGTGGDQGKLYMTNDGGQTWEQVTTITSYWGSFTAIWFTDAFTGYVGTTTGYILKTVDGGATWDMQSSGGGMVRDFSFYNASNGYCAVEGGGYSKTTDGGASWVYVSLPFGGCSAYSSATTSDSVAYVIGCNGNIFRTQASGLNWTNFRPAATSQTLLSIFFTNPSTAYTVGNSSTILKTTNAGGTWNTQISPVASTTFNSVFFTDDNTGFIAGSSGKLLSTVNGGTDWTTVATGTTTILNGIHFPTAQTGYVAGQLSTSGKILKTTDAGATWTLLSNTARTQYSVYFTSADTGYTCGSASTVSAGIFKTTDGGTNWVKTTITETSILYSIVFPQKDTGYCAGSGGVILKTTDAGTSWTPLTTGQSLGIIKSLFFFDANTGFAISGNKLIKTVDGGQTWELETINQNLLGQPRMFCLNQNSIWAVSNLGVILHKTGAIPPATFAVTGGGSYCTGESGLPVGLANSETGVTYILYKDNVAQVPTIPGTGSAISFGNQTAGTYTVEGTNSAGTTPMTGSAVITENPALTVSVTISADVNPVPAGNEVILTALPVNGGTTPSYQWMLNGINTGTDNPVFTFTPANNDAVTCTLTSDEACATGNPAVSNEIILSVIPATVSLLNIMVADGQTNCYNALQTIYVAGGGNTFTVQAGGSATMIAGQNIIYLPGTTADSGAYMLGYITLDGNYCTTPSNPLVSNLLKDGESQATGNNVPVTDNFRIYPNPTTGIFTLEQTGFVSEQPLKLEIYTMLGKRLVSDNIAGEKKHQFNLGDVPAGIYIIRIMTGEKIESIKLVKQ
ncbi:MAG: YCF48-related protein [Bacteroidales bacterium]|nr:YCF48-related protein [Bacteroidales bacterium]